MWFFTLILKNLLRRKIRSALTVLGVAIAVGTMITLLGISHGFEESSVASFEKRGVDLVIVEEGVPDQLNSNLPESLSERILEIPEVKAVGPGLLEIVSIPRGRSIMTVLVQGWRTDSFLLEDLKLLEGRRFRKDDKMPAMLGATLARTLDKKVGDSIEIQGETWNVVGIYKSINVIEDGAVTVPLDQLQPIMAREGRVTGFSVVLKTDRVPPVSVDDVREKIASLRDEEGKRFRLSVLPTQEYITGSMHIQAAHAMAWMTSAVAILIGAVSMLNTMFMLVIERTREIGILRAIGWKRSRVLRMVLGEAIVLSAVGAVAGALAAIAITWFLTRLPEVSGYIAGDIGADIFLRGFLMALVVGVVGGAYPAIRAALLAPTEAIRHE